MQARCRMHVHAKSLRSRRAQRGLPYGCDGQSIGGDSVTLDVDAD